MRIFFLSTVSPFDRNSWSGITYHTYHALAEKHQITWSGKPVFSYWQQKKYQFVLKMRQWRNQRFTDQTTYYSKMLSAWAQQELVKNNADLIVIGSGEAELFAFLETKLPIVYVADSTFCLKVNYYPWHTGLSKKYLREGKQIETLAISKASQIIYSSQWAANSAINDHGAKSSQISILPFGPNLSNIQNGGGKPRSDVLRLLFIGTDWKRKGGEEALEVYNILKKSIGCELVIVGSDPDLEFDQSVRVFPYLDKNKEEDEQIYSDLLSSGGFLLLPTQADCTPIVISEAAAYGLPVISYNTGGVGELVKNGITGYCLAPGSGPEKIAETIAELWNNDQEYIEMKAAIRRDFSIRLNWSHWLRGADDVFCRLLEHEKKDINNQF